MSTTKNKSNLDFKKRFHQSVNSIFGEIENAKLEFKVQTGKYADGTTWITRRCCITINRFLIKGYVQKTHNIYCDLPDNPFGSGWKLKSGDNSKFKELLSKVKTNYKNAR